MNANLCAGAIWTWREGVSCSTHWGAEPESVSAHSVGSSAWWAYSVENALSIIRWNVSIKIKEMLIPVCFSGFCVARKLRTAAELKHLSHIRHIFFFFFFNLCLLFFSRLEVSDGWHKRGGTSANYLPDLSASLAACQPGCTLIQMTAWWHGGGCYLILLFSGHNEWTPTRFGAWPLI